MACDLAFMANIELKQEKSYGQKAVKMPLFPCVLLIILYNCNKGSCVWSQQVEQEGETAMQTSGQVTAHVLGKLN